MSASFLTFKDPSVLDFFSITILHFLNLGSEGVLPSVILMNNIISEINSAGIKEPNSIWSNVLHNKKESFLLLTVEVLVTTFG